MDSRPRWIERVRAFTRPIPERHQERLAEDLSRLERLGRLVVQQLTVNS